MADGGHRTMPPEPAQAVVHLTAEEAENIIAAIDWLVHNPKPTRPNAPFAPLDAVKLLKRREP